MGTWEHCTALRAAGRGGEWGRENGWFSETCLKNDTHPPSLHNYEFSRPISGHSFFCPVLGSVELRVDGQRYGAFFL